MTLKPGLGAFYAIQSGNGRDLFYSSWDPHGAVTECMSFIVTNLQPITALTVFPNFTK